MSIDTAVLDTSLAVVPDLAWSLETQIESPDADELLGVDDEQVPGERYGWGEVWRNAVLLVVVAAALAVLAAVLTSMRENHESAPAAIPPAPKGAVVCNYIGAGYTPQQIIEGFIQNGPMTPEDARAQVAAAIAADCPATEGLAGAGT